jgi:hypothetical protein
VKRSVGLVVAVRIPDGKDGHYVVIALQHRGTFNHEKLAPESYPGCCQVTCHGKLEGDEPVEAGLVREATEELGGEFAEAYIHGYHGEILVETRGSEKEVVTFGTLMPVEMIRDLVRLGPDTGGLVYVTAEQFEKRVVVIDDGMKVEGPILAETIAMFPDEIEAVKKAFEIFGKM